MFPGRAPAAHVALACYVGGARNPEAARLRAHELFALTKRDLTALLGINGKPVVRKLRHWSRGLPQYTIGHKERVHVVEAADQRVEGLFLVGNYLHGLSVGNCLATARAVSTKVAARLNPLALCDAEKELRSVAVGR